MKDGKLGIAILVIGGLALWSQRKKAAAAPDELPEPEPEPEPEPVPEPVPPPEPIPEIRPEPEPTPEPEPETPDPSYSRVNLDLGDIIIKNVNGIPFSSVGVDPDGLKSAVPERTVTLSSLRDLAISFTYVGPQHAPEVDHQGVVMYLWWEPGDYTPALRKVTPAPITAGGPVPPWTYHWISPFSGYMKIDQVFGAGSWKAGTYSARIKWGVGSYYGPKFRGEFRIQGILCIQGGAA